MRGRGFEERPRGAHALGASLALLAALLPAPASAQAPATTEHAIGLGLGYVRVGTLDEAASRLAYGANTYAGSLEYVGESSRLRWGIRALAANGPEAAITPAGRTIRFQSEAPDGTRDDVRVPMVGTLFYGVAELRLAYVVRLRRLDVIVGGSALYAGSRPQGFIAPGLLQRVTFEPSLAIRTRLDARQSLELEARTAIVGWATRLPYHQSVSWPGATAYEGAVRQGSDVRSPATLRTFDLLATYRLRLRSHLATRAVLAFAYLHDEIPRPLTSLTTRASLFLDVVF